MHIHTERRATARNNKLVMSEHEISESILVTQSGKDGWPRVVFFAQLGQTELCLLIEDKLDQRSASENDASNQR